MGHQTSSFFDKFKDTFSGLGDFFKTFFDNDPTKLPDWAGWIKTNWKTWESTTPGPEATFTVIGALSAYILFRESGDLFKYGITALSGFTGYALANGITQVVNSSVETGWFAVYINDVFTQPFLSLVWVTSLGLITLVVAQIFGGELIDWFSAALPWLEFGSLGVEFGIGSVLGFVSLPQGILLMKGLELLMFLSPVYWGFKILEALGGL